MIRTKARIVWTVAVTAIAGAAVAALLPSAVWSSSGSTREIRLVVRDMTYYVEGEGAPNPTLRVAPGEHVRVLLRNDDAGMSHDFAIRAWNTGTGIVNGLGEAAVEFTAPQTAGEETYACTPHGEMMRGTIRID
jgi:plastocyanin